MFIDENNMQVFILKSDENIADDKVITVKK